jgi:hypothetical protein
MKVAIAKIEENRLNKAVLTNVGRFENLINLPPRPKIQLSSPDRHYDNRRARADGLIGAQNGHNTD